MSPSNVATQIELRCSVCRSNGHGRAVAVAVLEGGLVLPQRRAGSRDQAIEASLAARHGVDGGNRTRWSLVDQDCPRLRCRNGHRLQVDDDVLGRAHRLGERVAYLLPA